MSTLKILSDINCTVRCDFKEVGNIQAGELYKLQLKKGCYILEFLVEDIVICSMDYTIETNDEEPLLRLNIKEQAEKKIMEQKFIRNKSTNVNIYLDDNNRYILDCEANNPIVIPKGYDLYYKSIDGQYIEDEAGYLPFRITIVEERIENGETNKNEKTLYGSLNKLGEIIIKPIYNEPVIFYNSEIARTARNKCLIHVNHYGEEIALSYLNTDCFDIIAPLDKKDNLFIAKSTEDKSCFGVVRYDKKIIVSLSNKTIYKNTGDYIWALKGDTLSIYNNEGKWVKSIRYVDLGEIELRYGKHQDYVFVHKEAVAVRVSGYWGLYDFEGNEIFPHIYEHLDTYWIDKCGFYHSGNYYGSSPLMFVKKRNGGYGIISINVFDISDGIKDVNDIKEIIPCKYDAIYSNDGKQIIDFNGNFFLYEEQDEKGNHYDVGVGDDILFVKYCDDFMECDYFCENMLALSSENSIFIEEHFECKKFNQYYYIDVTGKYCLRKKYRDSNTYEKVNLFKVYVGNNEFCGGYVREEEYTTIIEAINGNHRVIIINEYTLWDDWSGLHSGRTFPTSRFEIHSDFDEILGIIIEIEFKDTISLRVRRGYKVLNIVVELVRNRKGNPTISNMFDYPIIENLLIMRTHDELVKQPHLFFDTETTGVPKDYKAPSYDTRNWPRLVQLAWILTDDKGHLIYSRNLIIKPDGFDIPSEAVIVHGISTQKALEAGIPLKEVIEQFQIALNVAECIVGHNVAFDKKIVGAEMIRLGLKDIMDSKKSHCTMQSSIDFCKIPGKYGYKYPKLQELYKKLFGIEFDNAHNAMSDIEATEKCFWELRKRKLI